MTEEAQAVAEIAKTAGEAIQAAGGLGSYFARVFASIPDNLLGLLVGDWLEHKRRRNLAVLEANTARILADVPPERLAEPSPSVLIPLVQAAIDESRTELQELWAALLANSMLDGGRKVRRDYFEAVKQMEPSDALLLDIISRRRQSLEDAMVPLDANGFVIRSNNIARKLAERGVSANEQLISVAKLQNLNYVNSTGIGLTAFGWGLVDACRVT